MLKTFLRLLSIKPILVTFLILVAGAVVGAYMAYDHYWVKNPPVKLVKSRLWGRIEDKAHKSKFDGGIKLADEADPTAAMNKQYDSATTWQMMYQFFGEHLWQAEQMLAGADHQKQQNAFRIMSEVGARAARSAYRDGASDPWIGARIAQAYFVPNLPIAKAIAEQAAKDAAPPPPDPKAPKGNRPPRPNRPNMGKVLTEERLIREANRLYENNGEIASVFKNYELLARIAPTNQINNVRVEYAQVLENYREYDKALAELSHVTNTNMTAKLEQRLKTKIAKRDEDKKKAEQQ
jgi:hypothetical protein